MTTVAFIAIAVVALLAVLVAARFYSQLVQRRASHPYTEDDLKRRAQAARKGSQAALGGNAFEQVVSLLPEFRFNPNDARFLGDPIDYVIFDGLHEGQLREIVLLEVKSGADPRLRPSQRQVMQAVREQRVGFERIPPMPHRRRPRAEPGPESPEVVEDP